MSSCTMGCNGRPGFAGLGNTHSPGTHSSRQRASGRTRRSLRGTAQVRRAFAAPKRITSFSKPQSFRRSRRTLSRRAPVNSSASQKVRFSRFNFCAAAHHESNSSSDRARSRALGVQCPPRPRAQAAARRGPGQHGDTRPGKCGIRWKPSPFHAFSPGRNTGRARLHGRVRDLPGAAASGLFRSARASRCTAFSFSGLEASRPDNGPRPARGPACPHRAPDADPGIHAEAHAAAPAPDSACCPAATGPPRTGSRRRRFPRTAVPL